MQWSIVEIGSGRVERGANSFLFRLPATGAERYADGQIDDTTGLSRRRFRWHPPCQFELRARFSHPAGTLRGTAGFGLWNLPIGPGRFRIPALPRALWFFFGSQPYDVPLALDIPGHGWKAACLDAGRLSALAWAPLAPPALIAMRKSSRLYRWLWPRIQQALSVSESLITVPMTDWHRYRLEWRHDGAALMVDEQLVLHTGRPPRGPLSFVAWMDNQYAVATPQGSFGWGLVPIPDTQWLEIANLTIR